jgi:hypothetical protein
MEMWEVLELPALTEESLNALLRNEVGVVTVPDFVDQSHREVAATVLEGAPDWSFYEGTTPPLGRLGITQYEHYGDKEGYLRAAAGANARRSATLKPLPDPLQAVMDAFAAAWSGAVGLAEEDGSAYFAGIFRSGAGGVKIHADWGPRDGEGWAIERIQGQFAWNLFYTSPGSGGELIVYDYPWEPELEEHAGQRFSDYDPKLFESSRRVEVAPEPGMLMVFNSRNAHAVTPASAESASRIAFGSFIGVTDEGDLAFWS